MHSQLQFVVYVWTLYSVCHIGIPVPCLVWPMVIVPCTHAQPSLPLCSSLAALIPVCSIFLHTPRPSASYSRSYAIAPAFLAAFRFHSVARVALSGALERVVLAAVEEQGSSLLGIQLPAGTRGVPNALLPLLRSSKAATLLYRDTS